MQKFERLMSRILQPWAVLAYMLLVVGSILYVDKFVALWIDHHHLPQQLSWLLYAAHCGESKWYLSGLLILAGGAWCVKNLRLAKHFGYLWVCVLIPNVIGLLLKMVCGRARPELWFSEHIYGFYGFKLNALYWSFPSGHVTTIVSFTLGLYLWFPRVAKGLSVLAAIVIMSRVLLLQHFVADVLMATWLTLAEIFLLIRVLRPFKAHVQSS